MKLTDNSGGIWTEILIRKTNPDIVLNQMVLPDRRFTRMLADEGISSIKGSAKHQFIIDRNNGKLNYRKVNIGTYKQGILKRKTPDGAEYEPLHDSTLRHREWKAQQGELVRGRGPAFVLRETSQHIFEGLHIKSLTVSQKGSRAVIGWEGNDEVIALKRDQNSMTGNSLWFGKKPKFNKVVEARSFRGFALEFVQVFSQMVDQLRK